MVKLAEAWGARLSETRIRLYAISLADVDLHDLRRACGDAVRECRYFPSVSELRGFVGLPSREDAALVAWAAFGQAASSAGAYASVVVDDSAAAEALEQVFGSWAEFCAMEDGPALTLKRQEFLAAYRSARTRPRTGPRRLVGLLDLPPPDVAAHTWVAHIAGGAVHVERDRLQLSEGERRRAALPEAGTSE